MSEEVVMKNERSSSLIYKETLALQKSQNVKRHVS
jgi:hypothetical protein